MGQSTNAILFFGIDLGEDAELPWLAEDSEHEECEEFLADKLVPNRPDCDYEGNEELFDVYWDKRHAVVKDLGCAVATHCSCDYPMHYIFLTGFRWIAKRGYPEEIVSRRLREVSPDDIEKLRKFCELLGIPWETPRWYLASDWC